MQTINDPGNTGILSDGMPATFVAVNGRPADLPESLGNIRGIWVRGKRKQP
jgi:hypothetical protein